MSAIAIELPVAGQPAPLVERPARHLHLVPDLAPTPRLRPTRRGRALLLAMVVAAAMFVALWVGGVFGGPSAAAGSHTITVASGQTMSDIAAAELPQLSIGDAVAQIRLANNLGTSQVNAGQTLIIPAG